MKKRWDVSPVDITLGYQHIATLHYDKDVQTEGGVILAEITVCPEARFTTDVERALVYLFGADGYERQLNNGRETFVLSRPNKRQNRSGFLHSLAIDLQHKLRDLRKENINDSADLQDALSG